jgi:hypothetical protein
MTDAEFLRALELCTLPESAFSHQAHVRAAYLCLQHTDFPTALQRMVILLRRYILALGKPERYHETKTVAFMALIHRAIVERGDGGGWFGFAQRNPDLLDPHLLLHLYTRGELETPLARRTFLLPNPAFGHTVQYPVR